MKVTLLTCIFFFSFRGFGFCLPDSLESNLKRNEEILLLENLAQEVHESYQTHLGHTQELVIVFHSLDPRINAEIKKNNEQIVLELFGGMLSHSKINENSFRLLLCHELGHVFGGPPLKSRTGWSSTEGQADYYSGQFCAKILGMDEQTLLTGALDLTSIYAAVMREPVPTLEQCDEREVERINFGYPSVQCRLQTIVAGWNEGPRPKCWFKE